MMIRLSEGTGNPLRAYIPYIKLVPAASHQYCLTTLPVAHKPCLDSLNGLRTMKKWVNGLSGNPLLRKYERKNIYSVKPQEYICRRDLLY